MRILFAAALLFSLPAYSQDFSSFQKILDLGLKVYQLPDGGLQTAFDYQKVKDNSKTAELFKKQKQVLDSFDPKQLKTKEEANAFWINSYNFFMIAIIVDEGFKKGKLNIDGVKDFGSWLNPYKVFKREIFKIGGKPMSLDQIEKGTLLGDAYKKKGWKDARIHFAVNCASVGCPPLIAKVYNAKTLNQTLDKNIEMALKTPRHFKIEGKTLKLTHLFKWYKTDFEESAKSVMGFLELYIKDQGLKDQMKATKSIDHIPYDWNLNQPKNFR